MSSPTIVVGIDGSAPARAALRWATEYAELSRAHVRAVAVWQQPAPVSDGFGGMVPVAPDDDLSAQAQSWVDEAMAALPRDGAKLAARTVLEGAAKELLLDLAEDAQLLVLGNKRRGAVAAAVIGSVALSCVHHASCPVILVPEDDDAPAG
ncbi:MAG TPA: universal stress protein [Streptosporangiaceae bacterium]|jgi:nucleotide-binding universal stress UspA family protein